MKPDEFTKLVDQFAAGLPEAIARASFASIQQFETDFKGRVFNNDGSEDIKGNTRPYKSKSYIKQRAKKKNYTQRNVTHIYDRDLMRNVKKGTVKNNPVLRIDGDLNVIKARANEDHYPAPVFEADEREEKRVQEAFEFELGKYFKKFFD